MLAVFVVIAALDSISWRTVERTPDGQPRRTAEGRLVLAPDRSILDRICAPLTPSEKSYSAPFATHLLMKETVEEEVNGEVVVTRLASGLPVGADLEHADELTVGRALLGRREISSG